ncbi:MAG TPA: alpha/beta fold hydrolase [Candidatus Saccharimonadales bacterium]|nr:alpha/beta fold hydrolase [Candidatus Saccharimonadales bacterium]
MTPDEFTNQELHLDVGDGHSLYICDWGDKHAKTPFIYLHGGPGSQIKDGHREGFDPQKHRVIFFDQRGCGQSTPYGSLEHNTTDDLLEDITRIATHLKIKKFRLIASSWGSCLALLYAIRNPKNVAGLVLGGIFSGSRGECEWVEQGRFNGFYPEAWEEFLERTPKEHHTDAAAYHYKNILRGDAHQVFNSALAVEELEHSIMRLDDRTHPIDPATFDPTSARIFAHYFSNELFIPDLYILKNASKLTMPVWFVQGRYDMECPPYIAHLLHRAIPGSQLYMTIGGHLAEHETRSVLRAILLQLDAPHE